MFECFKKKKPLKIPNYVELWSSCRLDLNAAESNKKLIDTILLNQERYRGVEKMCNVPWRLVAAIHYRESSLSFKGCLHNGDPLHKKTTHVPKERGPFASWEDSAVDVFELQKRNFPNVWNAITQLEFAEKYNGLGYRKQGIYSPYVWAGTNHSNEKGKYVSDGRFDANANASRIGVAALLKILGA